MKSLRSYSFLTIIALVQIIPLLIMLYVSLVPGEISGSESLFTLSIQNYIDLLGSDRFDIYFLNSFVVGIAVTAGNLLFCLSTGYALARGKNRLIALIFMSVVGVLMIPAHVVMIPLYQEMVAFGWLNSYWALIVPWLVSPFGIFLVKQYIESLPPDIEDAARIDGAGEFRILFTIVAPLSKPILTVLAIYIFLANWNSFLFPFIFTSDESMRTLPVGLAFYLGKQSIDWGHLMAGASLSAIPIIIIFLIFQNKIIDGLAHGALKD